MVYAIVDDALSLDFPLGVEREVFIRREDAERFIEEVRGDEPKVAEKLRIEERQLEAGGGVRLRYGWAAKNTSQNDKFLRVQSGTVTLTGPNGYSVTDSWAPGDASGWTSYTQTTGTAPNGKTVPIFETHKWTYFGFLPAGNYSLSVDLTVKSAVTDGWTSVTGTWLKVTNCPVTVNQGP